MKKMFVLICMIVFCLCLVACSGEKQNKTDYYSLALEQKAKADYAGAELNFLKNIEENPTHGWSYLELADIYIRENEIAKAYDILMKGKEAEKSAEIGFSAIEDKLLDFNVANVITDSDELVRGRSLFDEEGVLEWYHLYNYAEDGTRTGITLYDGEGNKVDSLEFKYNSEKKPTEYYSYCKDGSLGKLEFEYNANGNVVKITEYKNGTDELLGYTYIEYNENGYKSREVNVYADNSPHWEYIYNYTEEKSGDLEIAFFGKSIGSGKFSIDEYGKVKIHQTRLQGNWDISIEHGFDYESNEERVEVADEMGEDVRVVCYGSSYFPEE